MNQQPQISVLMSVFNGEKYLNKAIDSVLSQTFNDFEFIIVDDGSKDGSAEIIKSYKDFRVKLYQQENRGLSSALNYGIHKAKGKYIARMDADDISNKTRFQEQIDFLEENPDHVVVGSFANYIDDYGKYLYNYTPPINDKDLKDGLPLKCPFVHSSVMMRTETLKEVGGYKNCGRYFYQEDLLLWIDLAKKGKFHNLDHYLVDYRFTPSSNSQRSRKMYNYQMQIVQDYFDTNELRQKDINLIRKEDTYQKDNERESFYYQKIGVIYLTFNFNRKLARYNFLISLRHNPKNIKSLLNLTSTFFPAIIIRGLRNLYTKLK